MLFERYRSLAFINTIEYGQRQKLDNKQRQKVFEVFNKKKKKFYFKDIKKALRLTDEVFNYEDKQALIPNKSAALLRDLFQPSVWNKMTDKQQHDVWHIIFAATDSNWLNNYAAQKWNFDESQLVKLKKVRFDEDYSNLSTKAIRNILPFLEMGYLYNEAVLLGGVKNAFGRQWDEMDEVTQSEIIDNVLSISAQKNEKGKLTALLKEYLKEQYNLTEKHLSRLYHHSEKEEPNGDLAELPLPKDIRNPIVMQALFEIRKLVNSLIETYGKPDRIHVELARELKMSSKQRQDIRFNNMEREEKNDQAKKVLTEYGLAHSRTNIHKYLLWKELEDAKGIAVCPYTGKTISLNDLFNENVFQIEHIIPKSISLDDSFINKTICYTPENQKKGDLTPYQFYRNNPQKWAEVKERAKSVLARKNYTKFKRFVSEKDFEPDQFISRQLNDTRYISKETANYLKSVCPHVFVVSGGVTSELRHYWGLNGILSHPIKMSGMADGHYWAALDPEGKIKEITSWSYEQRKKVPKKLAEKGELVHGFIRHGQFIPQKERDDHRHHAIDALTVAAMKVRFIQEVARWNKYRRSYQVDEFPEPWKNFHNDVRNSIRGILVSFSINRRTLTLVKKRIKKNGKAFVSAGWAARGQLHKETIYGKHNGPDGVDYYHVRKPLASFENVKQLKKIVDPQVKAVVREHLVSLGVDLNDEKTKIPKNAFFHVNEETKEQSPAVFLPNKRGEPVPINKVRIREHLSNTAQLKQSNDINQYVNLKNNHHVAIYKDEQGNYFERIVSFWEAVERKKQGFPIIDIEPNDGSEFITALQRDDMFLLDVDKKDITKMTKEELSKNLYRVQKISSSYYVFRNHLATTLNNPNTVVTIQSFKAWKKRNPIKIKIDILGNIHLA